MKPHIEWYKDLPNPYRQMAIDALNEQSDFTRCSEVGSLGEAINDGFWWRKTKQGDCFWALVYGYVRGREKTLPVLELEL